MSNDFVHIHVHSEYSLLDGLGRVKKLVAEAKRLGQPALALTDHGTMHGAIEFFRACKDADVKPLIGVESYQTVWGRPMGGRDAQYDRENRHLLLLAKDMDGYRNLLKIASHSQLEGYYYKPRVDHEFLAAHAKGLVATTGCMGAEVPQLLSQGKEKEAYERLGWYVETFGKENFFIELQEHDITELVEINKTLVPWADKFGINLVATNDVHYVREEDAVPHDVLLCVQTSARIDDEKRMRMTDASYFLKSRAQMEDTFRPFIDLPASAFDSTLRIAEMCEVDLEDDEYHLPDLPIPDGYDYQSYLRHLTEEGLHRLYGDRATDSDVQERLERELRIIHEMGFDVYFLIVADLCDYARSRNIWWNVRGSGAGSLVAYCTGITGLDPLKNALIFERFLNPGRVSMPDFDLDYPDDQREEMIRYTVEKYGDSQVAQIVTFGRMKARAAIRDVGRAKDIPLSDVDRIAKMIPGIPGKPVTIEQVLDKEHENYNPELETEYKKDKRVRDLLDTSMQLEGVARHSGIHAAAVIVADRELEHYTPLMRGSKSTVTGTIAQFEFPILESIGLLKVDFLGLSTLSVMREAGRLIKERHGIEYNLSNIPFEGEEASEAFTLLSSGEVSGVFQVESQGMRRVLTEMQPKTFEHIIATISLYRPGPLEYIPNFIRRLHGKEKVEYHHPSLEPILDETLGILVYQEQVIQVLSELAGYTPGEADLVRRAISKKKASEIEYHKNIFIEGCAKNDIPQSAATAIYEDIEFFARYGFNKCLPGDVEVIDAETGRLVRIKDLYSGKEQLSQTVTCDTEALQLKSGQVAKVMDNGVKPVYRLTTALGRTIEATANHPFYTFDGWRQLDDIEIGDQIALPRIIPVEGTTKWPEHEVIALGHLLAEGNLCHPHSVYFYSQDPEQVDDYVAAAENFENVTCSLAVHKATFSVYAKRLERSLEPGIVTWAKQHGIWGKGAAEKTFPEDVFTLTNRQVGLLISRMWEGDGHINSKDRSLFYATSSERLASQMQHLFLRLGIISRLRTVNFPYKEGRIGYQLFVTGNDNFIAFNKSIGVHFISADRRARAEALCLDSDRSLSTKDVVPVGVKTLVREAKEQAGVTWLDLNVNCGVAQREFYPTGAPGKSGFHRQTIQRLADYFSNDELRRYSESHIYWDKVISIEYVGEKQTYDLEVPGTHSFIANDILVHNSHAADYAVITVQTAYLKAHYPVDYMAALLLIERDKTEKVINFINECRRMGIDVLPPDINYSGLDFDIQARPAEVESQAHRDPNIGYPFPVPEDSAIRFGMAAIKNVGEGPVDVIIAARDEGGPFASLEDLCDRVDMRQVNKRALECLIKAGALDRFGKRSQLLAVLEQMVGHSAGIHNARESGQLSMFDLLGDDAAATAMPITLPDIEEAKGKERLQWEKELLGVYTISHPLQQLNIDLKGIVTCQCNELDERYDGKNVMLAGMIGEVRTIVTKKGDPMAFVKLEDTAGQCEVVVFPQAYEEFRDKLEPDSVVIIKGKAQSRSGQTSLLADSIQNYVEQAVSGGEAPSPFQKPLLDVSPTINGVAHEIKEEVPVYGSDMDSDDDNGDDNGDDDVADINPVTAETAGGVASGNGRVSADANAQSPVQKSTAGNGGDINDFLTEDAVLPTGEASPFGNDMPAWAAEEPADNPERMASAATTGDKPASNKSAKVGDENRAPSASGKPVETAKSVPAKQPSQESADSADEKLPAQGTAEANGVKAQNGKGGMPSNSNGPRLLTVTFRRSGDIDRDMFRLKELHECIRDPRGRDRFFIRVESKGDLVKLAFPDDPCSISERLTGELTKHFRVEVLVESVA